MVNKIKAIIFALMIVICMGAFADQLTMGILLVGPYNDHGWSQATFEGVTYVTQKVTGTKMVYVDKVNPADRPGTTASQLADGLVAQGATVIVFNSDDMKDEATSFAKKHPDIFVVMVSGDQTWKEGKGYVDLPNMVCVMGQMEYMKMVAGVAAAMTTKTGKIGFLGPLINDETRRLAVSAYLGARYAWVNYLKKDPSKLEFKVSWIGFWFNIPGVTSDPTLVTDSFFDEGYDVVISGIDTTEAVTEAVRYQAKGKKVWALPYDYVKALDNGSAASLGVPYFNWGPAFADIIKSVENKSFKSHFEWNLPDWKNINNPDTSAVGFMKGTMTKIASDAVDRFIKELATGKNLWIGPLNYQDSAVFLKKGETATIQQVWYMPQLLAGMSGASK